MSATEVPAVNQTESAPVAEEQEVSLQERLNAATEEEYKTWERTGEFPAIKPKSAEPPPKTETPAVSKEPSTTETGATTPPEKVETAPATETGKPQKKRNGDARILQLLDERKKEREEFETRLKEIENRIPKPAEVSAKPDSHSAAEPGKEIKASDAEPELGGINSKTGKPYQTVGEWQKDHSAWLRAQVLAEVEGKLTKSDQQRAQTEEQRKADEGLSAKFEVGRKKYADFNEVAGNPKLMLPPGSPTDLYIRNSENAAEVAYYVGQHPELMEKFYRFVPGKDGALGVFYNAIAPELQMMELARIEARLTLPKTETPGPKPPVPTKQLPPPPTVLTGKTSAVGDAVEDALHKKSFADYEKAANAAERKARRV